MNPTAKNSESPKRRRPARSASAKSVKGGSDAAVTQPDQDQVETVAAPAEAGAAQADLPEGARFHIFIIDTGWHSAASKVLRENLALIQDLNREDQVFFLDREMSVNLLRTHNSLMGRDPIISVHDMHSLRKDGGTHGFRLHLGLVRSEEKVLAALQMFANFLSTHRAGKNLEKSVRERLRLEGIAGAIQIAAGKSAPIGI